MPSRMSLLHEEMERFRPVAPPCMGPRWLAPQYTAGQLQTFFGTSRRLRLVNSC
jgi:hypothetical protein